MVRTSTLVVAALITAAPLAAQDAHVWTSQRPDGHAPLGVVADRTLGAGMFEIGYRFTQNNSEGVYFGSDLLFTESLFDFYQVVPLSRDERTHSVDVSWGWTDDVTFRGQIGYAEAERTQFTSDGELYVTGADGLTDLELSALYRFYDEGPYRAHAELGALIPTGDESPLAETPFSSPGTEPLPYDQRIGAGVFGVAPGMTASAQNETGTVGGQVRGRFYFGSNDNGYRPGNRYTATGWAAHRLNDFFSVSARLAWMRWSAVGDVDTSLDPVRDRDPGNDAFYLAGQQLDIPVGVNFYFPMGERFAGHRLALEYVFPVNRNYDGPQLGLDSGFIIGWQLVF